MAALARLGKVVSVGTVGLMELNTVEKTDGSETDVLALKNESKILGQWSIPVSGSRKSQASSR